MYLYSVVLIVVNYSQIDNYRDRNVLYPHTNLIKCYSIIN